MGKILFWLVVIFGLLFGLRMYNVAKARARARAQRGDSKPAAQAMVQCAGCGVFLPAPDARRTADGYRCSDPRCAGNAAR
jgi:hypothetical protein